MHKNDPYRRCQFIVKRKNRPCRMLVKSGQKYCGEHAGEERNRIKCPLNPNHTVDADDLKAHLLKCNSRLRGDLPYVTENLNVCDEEEDETIEKIGEGNEPFALNQISDEEIDRISEKIDRSISENRIFAEEKYLRNDYIESVLENENAGAEARKHLRQQSSILTYLENGISHLFENQKNPKIAYVEFGAGKAKLSTWLAKILDRKTPPANSDFVLIEREGQRYKSENKLGAHEEKFQRIRCAIEHVDLKKVERISRADFFVGLCKHLCGSGTDAACRCVTNAVHSENGQQSLKLATAVLATCCHHRCEWTSFFGRSIFRDRLGFSEHDFRIVAAMTSWATCGSTDARKKMLGRKCKLLLDYCRAKTFEKDGIFEATFFYYIPEDVTPENLLIVLTPKECIKL